LAGETLLLAAHLLAALPQRLLRAPVGNLRADSHRIGDALVAVVSGV